MFKPLKGGNLSPLPAAIHYKAYNLHLLRHGVSLPATIIARLGHKHC
jgi:hypothetical protein